MWYNQIHSNMLYNHVYKDILSCSTIWNMMRVMLHCDIIPMNKGLWGYSVSIFEDEGRGMSSACSASPSPRAVRVWRPLVGHPPLTTSTQGKSGLPPCTDGRFQKVTRPILYSIPHIPIWTYPFLFIYLNKHIVYLLYNYSIIYIPDYILIRLYTSLII